MGKCIVPAVVVWEEKDGTIWPTDNGVQDGEFGPVGDGYWHNVDFVGKCMGYA